MQNRTLIWSLAGCFLMIGIGILVGSTTTGCAQDIPPAGPSKNQMDEIAKLLPRATAAFAEGRYKEAADMTTEICKLSPANTRYHSLLGEICFAAGQMDKCVAAYDEVIRLRPSAEPQLWQRGLALYYADRFADGVKQFETHQKVNSQDVENAVWHLLCAARISDVEQARKKLIPITRDPRVPMSQIYEMFAGRMTPEDVLKAAQQTSARAPEGSDQQKLQLYYAYLYTGLFHEMLGDQNTANLAMKRAEENNMMGKTNFMGQVARVHLLLREKTTSSK